MRCRCKNTAFQFRSGPLLWQDKLPSAQFHDCNPNPFHIGCKITIFFANIINIFFHHLLNIHFFRIFAPQKATKSR